MLAEEDKKVFCKMVETLVLSATDEKDFGLREMTEYHYKDTTTRYCDIADVLTGIGVRSSRGKKITTTTLQRIIGLAKKDLAFMDEIRPSLFDGNQRFPVPGDSPLSFDRIGFIHGDRNMRWIF